MAEPVSILLACGSLRAGSTNAAVLRTVQSLAPDGVEATFYDALATLPHFNPDDDYEPLPPAVIEMRAGIAAASAVVFCTPEYAGALPGSLKNLLDWTVGGGEIYGKPVAWINASGRAAPTGGAAAHDSLRSVLGYTGADIVEAACVRVPVARDMVDAAGLIRDDGVRAALIQASERSSSTSSSAHAVRQLPCRRYGNPTDVTGAGRPYRL